MDELITAVFVLILVLLIATVGVIMIVGEPISQYQVTCADPDYEITVSGFRTLIGNYALETEGGVVLVPIDRCIIKEIKG